MTSKKSTANRRKALDALKDAAYSRTEDALRKIQSGMAVVEEELQSGVLWDRLARDDKVELEQGDFMVLCGLGWNFLNGPKHKETTKPDVVEFLAGVNRRLREQLADLPDVEIGRAPTKAYVQLQARYERLKKERDELRDYLNRVLTRTHEWHLERLQALRMVRELKEAAGVSVVHLRRR
ncbi:hypothetical protein HJA85_07900 [Rhizobium bangladeshense]|uniref:hypothetical protein n=1 Tax=Rhizobium TaxID=379 RepID=UPI001C83D259|nr:MULTISPECIES: hypothetical protein [Rhizobium]MBX4866890.1 hypothetical protein [Rhizobium bangladeshense]MCV9941908.1 hypothetical protein [Rhizobium sp. BT-175]